MDNSWIDIQKNTFTNWCNAWLEQRNLKIHAIENDLADGILIINLYELISNKRLSKYHKNPKTYSQKLENISLVFKSIRNDQMNLVNIGPTDILQKNQKLILGFIWHLILFYQFGNMEPLENVSNDTKTFSNENTNALMEDSKTSLLNFPKNSPIQAILDWVRTVLPNERVTNLSTDWNNGILLGRLINALKNNCIEDLGSWKINDKYENCKKALYSANKNFNVPIIISAENMSNKFLDDNSMATYLSFFLCQNSVGEKWIVDQLNNKFIDLNRSLKNCTTDWNNGNVLCTIVEKCAPGSIREKILKHENPKNKLFPNRVELYNIALAMKSAEQNLQIKPTLTPVSMNNPDISTLSIISYASKFLNVHIPNKEPNIPLKMIFKPINIEKFSSPVIRKPLEFTIEAENCTDDNFFIESTLIDITIIMIDPKTNTSIGNNLPATIKQLKNTILLCEFTPSIKNVHYRISVDYNGLPVRTLSNKDEIITGLSKSIIEIDKIKLEGTDFRYVIVGENVHLTLTLEEPANQVTFTALNMSLISDQDHTCQTKNNHECFCLINRDETCSLGLYNLLFIPSNIGTYKFIITIDDQELLFNDMICRVADPTKTIISKQPSNRLYPVGSIVKFFIDALNVGPSHIECDLYVNKNEPIQKYPLVIDETHYEICLNDINQIGSYKLVLYINGFAIVDSDILEFQVYNIQQLIISPLFKSPLKLDSVAIFEVDLLNIGKVDDFNLLAIHEGGTSLTGNNELKSYLNRQRIKFTPKITGRFKICALINDQMVETQHYFQIIDLSSIKINFVHDYNTSFYVNKEFKAKLSLPFEIDDHHLTAHISTPENNEIILSIDKILQNFEGLKVFDFHYLLEKKGKYNIKFYLEDYLLEENEVNVKEFPLPEKIQIKGLEHLTAFINTNVLFETNFYYEVSNPLVESILIPFDTEDINPIPIQLKDYSNFHEKKFIGNIKVNTCGKYMLNVYVNNNLLIICPIELNFYDLNEVLIEKASPTNFYTNQIIRFFVYIPIKFHIKDALVASLVNKNIQSEEDLINTEPQIKMIKELYNSQILYEVTLLINREGQFKINFLFNGYKLTNYNNLIEVLKAKDKLNDYKKIKVSPINELKLFAHSAFNLFVDCRCALPGKLEVEFYDKNNKMMPTDLVSLRESEDESYGIYEVYMETRNAGDYTLNIKWNQHELQDFPYRLKIKPRVDPLSFTLNHDKIKTVFVDEPLNISLVSKSNPKEQSGYLEANCYTEKNVLIPVIISRCLNDDEILYNLSFKSNQKGIHVLDVKIDGIHVSGSPFHFKVRVPPDPSKVVADGPGLKSGVIGNYEGCFDIQTKGAGSGRLQVLVTGPKGSFKVKFSDFDYQLEDTISFDSSNKSSTKISIKNQIHVMYDPTDVGKYNITILWNNQHINGSPFKVYILKKIEDVALINSGFLPEYLAN